MIVAASFEACSAAEIERDSRGTAQIFENLVGRNSRIRQNSEFERDDRYDSKDSNESLIPAQNQRWRRA